MNTREGETHVALSKGPVGRMKIEGKRNRERAQRDFHLKILKSVPFFRHRKLRIWVLPRFLRFNQYPRFYYSKIDLGFSVIGAFDPVLHSLMLQSLLRNDVDYLSVFYLIHWKCGRVHIRDIEM
uniref:Uncharacterized protein n=1 Tax=Cucumis melo TaxID=3656 RepID=A0A9I9EMH1_CUCME